MLNGMSDPQQPQTPPHASQPTPPPQAHQPPQAYAQPQPVYAQPAQRGYAQPVYSPPAVGPTDSNAPGKIGFIIGLVGLSLSLLLNVIIQIMIRSQGYELINLISGVMSVIIFLAAAAALVFGIIGLRRVGAPHALAGIATGLGGAGVVGTGFNFILNAFSAAFYF